MEFYKKASTANWIRKGRIVSKGIYDMEYSICHFAYYLKQYLILEFV